MIDLYFFYNLNALWVGSPSYYVQSCPFLQTIFANFFPLCMRKHVSPENISLPKYEIVFSLLWFAVLSYIILYKIFLSSKQEAQRYFFSWNPFHENFQRHADKTLFTFWKQSDPAACLYNGALVELLFHDLPEGVAPNDSISYLVTLRNLRKIYTHT